MCGPMYSYYRFNCIYRSVFSINRISIAIGLYLMPACGLFEYVRVPVLDDCFLDIIASAVRETLLQDYVQSRSRTLKCRLLKGSNAIRLSELKSIAVRDRTQTREKKTLEVTAATPVNLSIIF